MEEPLLTGGRTLVWANPELLPESSTPGSSLSAIFRVQTAVWRTFAVGVRYPHTTGGGAFAATQYTAELTWVGRIGE